MKKCGPKGRDCIERNAALTFKCSTNCVGIYADVQWQDESITIEGKIWKRGEEMGNKKYRRLLTEYTQFKTRVVRHFRFKESTLPDFGMYQSHCC